MIGENKIIPCPFCDKGEIKCFHIPHSIVEKRSKSSTFGVTVKKIRTPPVWEAENDCPVCGKTKKQIQKRLKSGISNEMSKDRKKARYLEIMKLRDEIRKK